jgi:hypothetical protein
MRLSFFAVFLGLFGITAVLPVSAATLTVREVHKKWLPDFPGGPADPGDPPRPPRRDVPPQRLDDDLDEDDDSDQILIMELAPLRHLIRLPIFGKQEFIEVQVGERGVNKFTLISFDREYRKSLLHRALESKIFKMDGPMAQSLRNSVADGVDTVKFNAEYPLFDPYLYLRFGAGPHFYTLVEEPQGLVVDPHRFEYHAIQKAFRNREIPGTRRERPLLLQGFERGLLPHLQNATGAALPALGEFWLRGRSRSAFPIPALAFAGAVVFSPSVQILYDPLVLGILAHRKPRLRPLRGKNFVNQALVGGVTATGIALIGEICQHALAH